MTYKLTIGLEIHAKLLTDSKVFCRCHNEQDFDTLPANTHVCPTCMGMPWALPTLSKECIEKAGALGMLLWCTQQNLSHFDRKSYFYPDLPMWYQITQFTKPLNIDGQVTYHSLDYSETKKATILQAHLECDTAKTTHFNWELLLDFNRAGTPLVEIVTAPDFHSADEVHGFLREIQRTLQYYNISEAQMDKWQMRCDVNISISKTEEFGTKVEIKNMNSISSIKKAIAYEFDRQSALLEAGKTIDQETRWWNEQTNSSFLMRSKENALDYRYFPEPDLPPVVYDETIAATSKHLIWETIADKINRYRDSYGFHKEYINGILTDKFITTLFETGIEKWYDPATLAKYIVNYILASTNVGTLDITHTPFSQESFFLFLDSIKTHGFSDNIAKNIIGTYLSSRKPMQDLINEAIEAKSQVADIDQIVIAVIENNEKVVTEYKEWKKTAIWFLVGQVMKQTNWSAQPQEVQACLRKHLWD